MRMNAAGKAQLEVPPLDRTIVTKQEARAGLEELRRFVAREKELSPVDQYARLSSLSGPASGGQLAPDTYVDQLLKYMPAESVALYLTLQGIVVSGVDNKTILTTGLWKILAIGFIGNPIYLWRIMGEDKIVQLDFSTLAFVVWVFALGGAFASLSWYEPFIGSVALVVFTFFAPLLILTSG
jgi:hypothetical protein